MSIFAKKCSISKVVRDNEIVAQVLNSQLWTGCSEQRNR